MITVLILSQKHHLITVVFPGFIGMIITYIKFNANYRLQNRKNRCFTFFYGFLIFGFGLFIML
ncbi:hypothetical protein D9M68_645210 [compost metagenome]